MSTLFQDLRYAFRTLKHNPGFAIVAIVSLALGIGATSAIFSFASFMLLRPLPVPDASGIIIIQSQLRGESLGGGGLTDYSPLSYPDFDDLQKRNNSFAGLSASQYMQFGFASDKTAPPEMKFGALVNGSFFNVLGVSPELGRGFRDDEDKVRGRNAVVVLGHDLWRTDFASNADVIGKDILLNGLPFTVIGVAPESFTGPNNAIRADLYVPLAMQPALAGSMQNELEARDLRLLTVYGRLKPGVGVRQAAAEARLISQQLAQSYPKANGTCSMVVATYRMNQLTSVPITTMLCLFLLALAAMVLLIACANVMNLMLSRASGRSREIAVRLAMGAKRSRLIRQLLTESLVIAILGGVLGLVVAQAGAHLFSQMRIPADVPLVMDVRLDRQVLLFTLVVSVASVVLFGLAPALQSTKPDLVSALKSTAAAEGKRHRLVGRNALVIAQVAASLLLLVAGTQAYRGASILLAAPAGFRSTHILLASFNPMLARNSAEQTKQFYKRLLEQARVLPGVKSAALAQAVPYVPMPPAIRVIPEGVQLPAGTEAVNVLSNIVSDDYFETIGVPIVEGRHFNDTDRENSERVAIVNERFAHNYYPNQDAVGKRLRLNSTDGTFVKIIGVAKQSKYIFPIEPSLEHLYLPLVQNPPIGVGGDWSPSGMTLMLETEGPSSQAAGPLRELVRRLDSRQPIYSVRSIEDVFDMRATKTLGLFIKAIGGLALLGLALALIGLYGLMTYSVSLRQREIGIRMAIGGDPPSVVRMVLRQGMMLAGSGVALGLVLSVLASKPTAVRVYAHGFNLSPVALVTVALLIMAALGAYIPARRASQVDPNIVLRQE
ncbi:MAG: ABC transporter permease [Candidatus Korobacteraceae bacterium]|jgi:predicted permease